jgi:hypothetical protein
MCLAHKDVSEVVKNLAHGVEEGVNTIKDPASTAGP